jgi:F-type H+-transporting ATPase subunit gamma
MAGGLKEVRERIGSVQNTMQITSAMKMVSAAKLRRAQNAITQMRPYAEKIQAILANVSASLDSSEGVFSTKREVKTALVIVITSNRGLCGGFNNNSIKIAQATISQYRSEGANVVVLPL